MHGSEREAIRVSILHLLNDGRKPENEAFAKMGGFFRLSDLDQIEKHLPILLPLFSRLTDPRNSRPLAGKTATHIVTDDIDTRTLHDVTDVDASPLTIDATADEPPIEWGAGADIDINDLRPGQWVESTDANDEPLVIEITDITCDNQPEPLIIGWIVLDGEPLKDMPQAMGHLDMIKRVVSQPEDRMTLTAAREALDRLDGTDMPAEGTADRHKQRVLLLRRIAQLEAEEQPAPTGPNDNQEDENDGITA
jgi:hypothetical protein